MPPRVWQAALVAARHEEGNARGTRDRLTHELGLEAQVHAARLRWGDHVPDGPEYAETAEAERIQRREKSAPWADAERHRGADRTVPRGARLLHKALILAEAHTFPPEPLRPMDILDGKGHPSNAATRAAWQTLFLVVPSYRLRSPSVGRMFTGLGRESLGWLLVDEAGQAAPQNAVGALWRAGAR